LITSPTPYRYTT